MARDWRKWHTEYDDPTSRLVAPAARGPGLRARRARHDVTWPDPRDQRVCRRRARPARRPGRSSAARRRHRTPGRARSRARRHRGGARAARDRGGLRRRVAGERVRRRGAGRPGARVRNLRQHQRRRHPPHGRCVARAVRRGCDGGLDATPPPARPDGRHPPVVRPTPASRRSASRARANRCSASARTVSSGHRPRSCPTAACSRSSATTRCPDLRGRDRIGGGSRTRWRAKRRRATRRRRGAQPRRGTRSRSALVARRAPRGCRAPTAGRRRSRRCGRRAPRSTAGARRRPRCARA